MLIVVLERHKHTRLNNNANQSYPKVHFAKSQSEETYVEHFIDVNADCCHWDHLPFDYAVAFELFRVDESLVVFFDPVLAGEKNTCEN